MISFAQPQPSLVNLRTLVHGREVFHHPLTSIRLEHLRLLRRRTANGASQHARLARCPAENAPQQPATILGMRMADSYRSIHRSLLYITLFLSLVFLTYFLFEVLTGKIVHPARYALVGIAQTIFYLLLLWLAEHLGSDLSFLLAGVCTVALLSVNTDWIFRSRKLALRALAVLYAFIYAPDRVAHESWLE